jgi:phosphoglycolate phosphatase
MPGVMNHLHHRLVIFDLDGTLVNSLGDLAASMNAVLASLGYPQHPTAPYRRFVGDGIAMLVRRALPPDVVDDDLVARCVGLMRAEYARRQTDTTLPYPGIPELLATLARQRRLSAVLSNKPDGPTRELVRDLLAPHRFDAVRGARPETPLKPDPTAALEIATELDAEPERTAFVGDTNIDMATARNAGMTAVGATWGFRDADELRSAGAHHIIDRPAALLDRLD